MKAATDAPYVGRFRKAAERPTDRDLFRGELLELLVGETAAAAGRLHLRVADDDWRPGPEVGLRRTSSSSPCGPESATLEAVRRKRQTLFVAHDSTTRVLHPLDPAGEAVVELTYHDARALDTPHISRVLAVAAAADDRHARLAEQRRHADGAARLRQERDLRDNLLACRDMESVAAVLANDARVLVDAERVGVWLFRGRPLRLTSMSGQDRIPDRSDLVEALTRVVAAALAHAPRPANGVIPFDAPHLTDAPGDETPADILWRQYAARFGVRTMRVAPLHSSDSTAGRGEPLGAVVAEYLAAPPAADDSSSGLAEIARAGARAVELVDPRSRRPALRLFRRRRALIATAVAAAIGLLLFVPVPADISCRGVLQPAEKRNVFAPSPGVVEEIFVADGQQVAAGQKLLRLRSVELETDVARLEGEQAAGERRLAAVKRIRTAERNPPAVRELEAEASELTEKLASIDRQLAVRRRESAELTVYAPAAGTVSTSNLRELLDRRPVARGQMLLTLCRLDGPWRLELQVAETDGGRLAAAFDAQSALDVTFSPASDPFSDHRARLSAPPLVAQTTPEGAAVLTVEAECESEAAPYEGGEVVARIHAGGESLGSQLFGGVGRMIRHRILFRWF